MSNVDPDIVDSKFYHNFNSFDPWDKSGTGS